jgi:hypothetical protein
MENRYMKISETHELGKKLPVYPLLVLSEIGPQMCYRECQAYTFCLSINFNRKMLTCELNSQRKNGSLSLIADNDFIYRDIPDTVSTLQLLSSIFKLDKNSINGCRTNIREKFSLRNTISCLLMALPYEVLQSVDAQVS